MNILEKKESKFMFPFFSLLSSSIDSEFPLVLPSIMRAGSLSAFGSSEYFAH